MNQKELNVETFRLNPTPQPQGGESWRETKQPWPLDALRMHEAGSRELPGRGADGTQRKASGSLCTSRKRPYSISPN